MKAISSFATTFRNSKLSGKIAITCSALLFLCLCTSVPIGLLSSSITAPTQIPTTQNILTPIYETAQAIASSTATQTALIRTATLEPTSTSIVALPTATLKPAVVLPANVASCVPTNSTREEGLVIGIIDGDTIDVAIGNQTLRVRYIGIDTPETSETYFWDATARNQNLVYGKQIILIKDVSETDQFDRLLRYVFVGDTIATFVNYELVRQGYAHASTYPPDVACADYFAEAQNQAQNELIGLWAPAPSIILNPVVPTQPSSYTAPTSKPSKPSSCCKICTTGKACGNSCISRNYTCHQPPGCACDG